MVDREQQAVELGGQQPLEQYNVERKGICIKLVAQKLWKQNSFLKYLWLHGFWYANTCKMFGAFKKLERYSVRGNACTIDKEWG